MSKKNNNVTIKYFPKNIIDMIFFSQYKLGLYTRNYIDAF